MRSVYMTEPNPNDPISAIRYGDRPLADAPDGWTTVTVKATSVNRHDLFALSGIGPAVNHLPMILGSDAAGLDESGRRVLINPVIDADGQITLLSEFYQGTFAEKVIVPESNLVSIPDGMTLEEAACLPTAWITAYRMLFSRAGIEPGDIVLVQGAGGGLSTALIMLAAGAGARVWATAQTEQKKEYAESIGAEATFDINAALPDSVHHVMDSVGAATLAHSIDSLRPGGSVVVPGATSGFEVKLDLLPVLAKQLAILGSSLGSTEDFAALLQFCVEHKVRPHIHGIYPMTDAATAFKAMQNNDALGKLILVPVESVQ